MDEATRLLLAALDDPRALGRRRVVAFSGGMDSTCLLHALAGLARARDRSDRLRAIHVHHGLQAQAEEWTRHCAAICAQLGVPLELSWVQVERDNGQGLEGAARQARYAAFEKVLKPGDVLLMAHHLDDQAETFLLRALRASGPDGLAAMPDWRRLGAGWLWRPWLAQPRARIADYAARHRLEWIEDDSNVDISLDRNFLRHRVLPLLQQRWPQAAAALARSAQLSAQAADLLASEDAGALAAAGDGEGNLRVDALLALPAARRARVLRRWIGEHALPPLPARGIEQLQKVLHARDDLRASFAWSGACVRRWRERLHAGPQREPLPADWQAQWDGREPLLLPGGGMLALHGAERFESPLLARARAGGERIVLPGRLHSHALKHLLQEQGVPPWLRERLPLLWRDGELLAAGDRIVSATLQQWLDAQGARLAWEP
ncbi:MAG: tRNA lysidine(34) synthetase TilS [Pseudoxanthomonas sp.]